MMFQKPATGSVEDEQQGKAKATYGEATLKTLATQLTLEFGKGFDERNLNNMRAFYRAFPIWNALRTELSWTHYRLLSRLDTEAKRNYYLAESTAIEPCSTHCFYFIPMRRQGALRPGQTRLG